MTWPPLHAQEKEPYLRVSLYPTSTSLLRVVYPRSLPIWTVGVVGTSTHKMEDLRNYAAFLALDPLTKDRTEGLWRLWGAYRHPYYASLLLVFPAGGIEESLLNPWTVVEGEVTNRAGEEFLGCPHRDSIYIAADTPPFALEFFKRFTEKFHREHL